MSSAARCCTSVRFILQMADDQPVALALNRVMASLLFEVTTTDPATFAGLSLLLVVIATIACLVPALRAARVDPVTALRCE